MTFLGPAVVPEVGFPPNADTSWAGPKTDGTLFAGEVEFPCAKGGGLDVVTDVSKSTRSQSGTSGAICTHASRLPNFPSSDDGISRTFQKKHV